MHVAVERELGQRVLRQAVNVGAGESRGGRRGHDNLGDLVTAARLDHVQRSCEPIGIRSKHIFTLGKRRKAPPHTLVVDFHVEVARVEGANSRGVVPHAISALDGGRNLVGVATA